MFLHPSSNHSTLRGHNSCTPWRVVGKLMPQYGDDGICHVYASKAQAKWKPLERTPHQWSMSLHSLPSPLINECTATRMVMGTENLAICGVHKFLGSLLFRKRNSSLEHVSIFWNFSFYKGTQIVENALWRIKDGVW